MHYARGWHAMVTYGDSIIVTGGNSGLSKRIDIHGTLNFMAMMNLLKIVKNYTLYYPYNEHQNMSVCLP